jgi:MFS family permease
VRWRRLESLSQLEPGPGTELARLSGLEGLSRAIVVGVIPLTALDALGSKTAVSYVFLAGACVTLLFTLNVGRLELLVQRRWVVTLSIACLITSMSLFMLADGPVFAVAIGLRSAQASLFSVCLSLYIMDYIGKQELTRTESRRMVYGASAWLIGPSAGIWLWTQVGRSAPFIVSIVMAIGTVAYFWRLRLHRNPVLMTPTTTVTHPFRNIARFFSQRHLRIAYAITTTRAVFWAALFVYGPIYIVEAGLPTWMAGVFLSIASSMLFIGPLVDRAARKFGTRQVIVAALVLMAAGMTGLAVIGDARPVGVALWILGAVGGAALDVLGNIPFMRMVKPRERIAMTTVFSTWREVSFLIAPAIAAGSLAVGSFWLLYVVIAVMLLATAVAATYLPRRL